MKQMALPLLMAGMISDLSSVQAELHTTHRLRVRFVHAPRVKLTLHFRPTDLAASQAVRILRLGHNRPATVATVRAVAAA